MVIQTTDLNKFQKRGKNAIRVLAFMEAKKDRGQELVDHVLSIVEPSRNEEGNISFVPHVLTDNPDQIMVDEIWTDKNALENHFNQKHIQDYLPKIENLLAKPIELKVYSEVSI